MSRNSVSPTLLFFTILIPFITHSTSTPSHFFKPSSQTTTTTTKSQQYFEVTRPLLPDHSPKPSCMLPIIRHSFADTINRPPFSTPYSPPSHCPHPWSRVLLDFRVRSKGEQYDRISALWLGAVEIFRTSTAQPTQSGVFWNVQKDITRYSSLLSKADLNFTLMLENVVNKIYTGIYHVEVILLFYKDYSVGNTVLGLRYNKNSSVRILREESRSLYPSPADLIVPISAIDGNVRGYWFNIERDSDVKFSKLRFPRNTYKAVLELYVSFHGNDEFFYSNPSNSYIRTNNLTTLRGNGAYREVYVTIDGRVVVSKIPFPVVFTGGINPLFWEPVVAIGAFDLPSYDFDLTPFLGMVIDGKDHVFGVGVSEGISYWLVDANLHIWLDRSTTVVRAKTVVYENPDLLISRVENFQMLDGSFRIQAERETKSVGWVKSSFGNLSTIVSNQFRFYSVIRFTKNGTTKTVKQKVRSKSMIKVVNEVDNLISHVVLRRKYPLKVITATLPGSKKDTHIFVTNISHTFKEKYRSRELSSYVYNKQVSNGWMEVKDHSVLSGEAMTNQTLTCRDKYGCYVRTVAAINGRLISDNSTYTCPSLYIMWLHN